MSQSQSSQFLGLTIKLIANMIDVSYHGVLPGTGNGTGILGQMYQKQVQSTVARDERNPSSGRIIFQEIPENELDVRTMNDAARDFRIMAIARYSEVNAAVSKFHRELNAEKARLLGGETMVRLSPEQLEALRQHMAPHAVGKVLKCKLQARGFSMEQRPRWNKVKSGGFSSVRVLYTFYIPYEDNMDVEAALGNLLDSLGSRIDAFRVSKSAGSAILSRVDDQRMVITPEAATHNVIGTDESGRDVSIPVESLRQEVFKGVNLFGGGNPRESQFPGPTKKGGSSG